MSPMESPQTGKDVLALNAAVSQLKRRVAELEDHDKDVAGKVSALASEITMIVEMLESEAAKPPKVWNWAGMTAEEAGTAWAVLLDWRRDVLRERYPTVYAATTRRCWYRHPTVVEELSVLYVTWRAAFVHASATPKQASDWLANLPHVQRRIDDQLKHCHGQHKEPWDEAEPYGTPKDHDDAEISEWIRADLKAREAAQQD